MVSISIKSEIDSRSILYPLMRCLRPLGNILIITSNKQVSRLIDGDYDGHFRNFHILVDVEGATDETLENAGISPTEYSYVVYDNVGVVEQDKLIIPIGPIISEAFEAEMMYLGEDKNTHILRYGRAIKKAPVRKTKEQRQEEALARKAANNNSELSEEEISNAASMKFKPKKEDITVKLRKLPNLQFPKLEDFELFESNKQFFDIDRNFIKFFFTIFQTKIGIKEPNFVREVTRKDARSSDISQRPASGENSVKLDD